MATLAQLSEQGAQNGSQSGTAASSAPEMGAEAALAKAAPSFDEPDLFRNPLIAGLPVEIDVTVPIRGVRVRNLLALIAGQVIESQWVQGDDLPLSARGTQLAWTEFEVIDNKLAVRITRLV
jgi:flagellar motor switch/type III secretory pathway protein FliN